MVQTFRGPVAIDGARVETKAGVTAGAGTTSMQHFATPFRRERFILTAERVTILEANDYGAIKLCDLPATNLIIAGAVVDIDGTGDGETGGVETITAVDVAIGTVSTTSTDFTNAGEDNIVPKIDVAAAGVTEGASDATTVNLYVDATAGTSSVYLNVAVVGGITADGYVDFSGWIDLVYLDLGVADS
jgi:hypothetical protein